MYSSRIHSSADEISSINRSPSEMSSSDESFSRTDFSRDGDIEAESPSPPSRPRSHAPWIYPSDIQIDPSSLEVSPKLPHMNPPGLDQAEGGEASRESSQEARDQSEAEAGANAGDPVAIKNAIADPLRNQRMPSVGPSPSPLTNNDDRESELDFSQNEGLDEVGDEDNLADLGGRQQRLGGALHERLNLPHGVAGVESCRSASPGDGLDSYRGESCGSFEFLGRDNDESHDEDQLFLPTRSEEKEAILRQIQTLNAEYNTSGDGLSDESKSRESSAPPVTMAAAAASGTARSDRSSSEEAKNSRPVESHVLNEIQKSIKPPPTTTAAASSSSISMMPANRSVVPLVVAVADAARNSPRMRGKPSRLRDLQTAVPLEENPKEVQPLG